jgi:hypothetical protein
MKKLCPFALLAAVMVALSLGTVGCRRKENNDKSAKENATKDVSRVKIEIGGEKHKQITVGLGEVIRESITLKRPAGVTKDLTCSVSGARDGVKCSVGSAKINGDEIDVLLVIEAAIDATRGQVSLTVVAETEGSPFASKIVPVLVLRKTSISAVKPIILRHNQASVEKVIVTLGDDAKDATVKLRVRDKDNKDAVGITAEAEQRKLDNHIIEVTVTLNVAEAAKEGDYRVEISVAGQHSFASSWSHSRAFDLKVERK